MARRLKPVILGIDLHPYEYEVRAPGLTMPRAPTDDDVAWDLGSHGPRVTEITGGWPGAHPQEVHTARARLPRDTVGDVITDDVFDVVVNGHRIVDSAPVKATGVRAWLAIELYDAAPTDTSVTYRLNDGTADRFWGGMAWDLATDDDAHWSTKAEVHANIATFPVVGRELTVRARLSSTTVDDTPAFYGFVLAMGMRDQADEDDALIRALLRSMRTEIILTGVARVKAEAAQTVFALGPEQTYDLTDVLAVFNLTDDPDELTELPGAFDAGAKTWTADTPIDADKVVHLEFEYKPRIVVSAHRDVEIEELPLVFVAPGGGVPSMFVPQAAEIVRDLITDPATGVGLFAPQYVQQPLELRAMAELAHDVRRMAEQVRAWLGGTGYRVIVSPETGRIVDVHEVTPFRTTTDLLAQGVAESRASWLIGYHQAGARAIAAVNLTRTGGVTPTVTAKLNGE